MVSAYSMESAALCAPECSCAHAFKELTCNRCRGWHCCAAGGGSDGGAAPTPLSQAGFKRLVPGKGQCLTLLSVEIVADCRCRDQLRVTTLPLSRHPCQMCSRAALECADCLSATVATGADPNGEEDSTPSALWPDRVQLGGGCTYWGF